MVYSTQANYFVVCQSVGNRFGLVYTGYVLVFHLSHIFLLIFLLFLVYFNCNEINTLNWQPQCINLWSIYYYSSVNWELFFIIIALMLMHSLKCVKPKSMADLPSREAATLSACWIWPWLPHSLQTPPPLSYSGHFHFSHYLTEPDTLTSLCWLLHVFCSVPYISLFLSCSFPHLFTLLPSVK